LYARSVWTVLFVRMVSTTQERWAGYACEAFLGLS